MQSNTGGSGPYELRHTFPVGRRSVGLRGSAVEGSARGAADAGDELEHRVERGRERFGVALDLSEQEAALKRGQRGQRELARIGLRCESAERVHPQETGHDAGLPAFERRREHHPGFGLYLGELGTERADRTAAAPVRVAGVLNHEVTPLPEAIEAAEVDLLLRADGHVGLALDDCTDQRRLVFEVVVELRTAHVRTVAHFLDRRAGNALLIDQLRRSVDDPPARRGALARQPRPIRARGRHGEKYTPKMAFTFHTGLWHNGIYVPLLRPTLKLDPRDDERETLMSTLPEKTVLITRANAGIGKEVPRQLALPPQIARTYLACRNAKRPHAPKADPEAA